MTEALQKKYGRADFISGHSHPYLYLNLDAIASAGLNVADVERFVADELMKIPGIAYAQTRSDLLAGRITESPVQNQIRRSFHPTRSGNIHMVPEQYWFLHSTEEAEKMGIGSIAAIHGSPWAYDTYRADFFCGPRRAGPGYQASGGPHRYRGHRYNLSWCQTALRFRGKPALGNMETVDCLWQSGVVEKNHKGIQRGG